MTAEELEERAVKRADAKVRQVNFAALFYIVTYVSVAFAAIYIH